ncbi:hypothetical protein KCP71_09390 [Salmonella enterica subsp. enterica]|nr:hypothetical protein KCP71_09390 [Salmonella enterica subsp. enterica]
MPVPAIVILGSYSVWLAIEKRRGWAGAFKTIVPQTPLDFLARWRWW